MRFPGSVVSSRPISPAVVRRCSDVVQLVVDGKLSSFISVASSSDLRLPLHTNTATIISGLRTLLNFSFCKKYVLALHADVYTCQTRAQQLLSRATVWPQLDMGRKVEGGLLCPFP